MSVSENSHHYYKWSTLAQSPSKIQSLTMNIGSILSSVLVSVIIASPLDSESQEVGRTGRLIRGSSCEYIRISSIPTNQGCEDGTVQEEKSNIWDGIPRNEVCDQARERQHEEAAAGAGGGGHLGLRGERREVQSVLYLQRYQQWGHLSGRGRLFNIFFINILAATFWSQPVWSLVCDHIMRFAASNIHLINWIINKSTRSKWKDDYFWKV